MIEPKDIEKLAALARIDLAKEEADSLRESIENILGYVSEIEQESVGKPEKKAGELRNVMREDGPEIPSGTHTETLLAAAPRRSGEYVAVKNIFEK